MVESAVVESERERERGERERERRRKRGREREILFVTKIFSCFLILLILNNLLANLLNNFFNV